MSNDGLNRPGHEVHVVRVIPRKGRVLDLARLEGELRSEVRPGDAVVRAGGELLIVLPETERGAKAASFRIRSQAERSSQPVYFRFVSEPSRHPHVFATLEKVDTGAISVSPRQTAGPRGVDPRYGDLLSKAGDLHKQNQELHDENRRLRFELEIGRTMASEPPKTRRSFFGRKVVIGGLLEPRP